MSKPWTQTSVSGACGPKPGGVNRCSACSRNSAAISASGVPAAMAMAHELEYLSKLPRFLMSPSTTVGNPTLKGITRWAATWCTVQPAHRLGTAPCCGVTPSRESASARRRSAIISNT